MKMNKIATLLTAATVAGTVSVAVADTITFFATETVAGSWDISVSITGGDSTGLAQYGFNVTGLSNSEDAESYSPNTLSTAISLSPVTVAGFSAPPILDDVGINAYSISHSQTFNPDAIFNIGVTNVNYSGIGDSVVLGVPAFLGTFTTDEVLGSSNFDFTASLFDSSGLTGPSNLLDNGTEVTFQSVVTPIPEPTSLVLIGLGGLLIARRRRA